MTHAEFHELISRFAAGRMFVTRVEVWKHPDTTARIEYSAYVAGFEWHRGATPAAVVEQFGTLATLADIDPTPSEQPSTVEPRVDA